MPNSKHERTQVVGLTGGIGSGKSTVAGILATLDVPVLDLDAVGHSLLLENDICMALQACFGDAVVTENGKINRQKLAALAFSDASKTQKLNQIMHPAIKQREAQWLAQQNGPYVVLEASVLLESGGHKRMDAVAVVLADQAVRQKRVVQRGAQDIAMFESIVARQCDDTIRKKYADFTLHNNGTIDALYANVLAFKESLNARFRG